MSEMNLLFLQQITKMFLMLLLGFAAVKVKLMPATAEHMRVEDPFDPRQNIMGGVRYLRRLSDRYDGDINLVLSGYHAGPGNVEKAGGIPFEKTQQYVRNVYAWYLRYRDAEKDDKSAKNDD